MSRWSWYAETDGPKTCCFDAIQSNESVLIEMCNGFSLRYIDLRVVFLDPLLSNANSFPLGNRFFDFLTNCNTHHPNTQQPNHRKSFEEVHWGVGDSVVSASVREVSILVEADSMGFWRVC